MYSFKSKIRIPFQFVGLMLLSCFVMKSNECSAQYNQGKQLALGITLRNNGWGIGIKQHYALNGKSDRHWVTEFASNRHHQEVKIINSISQNASPYVFGKLYHTSTLQSFYGHTFKLSDFQDNNRLHLSCDISAGAGLAFLKPVYLNIYHPTSQGDGIVIPERYNPDEHVNQGDIQGYSSFRYGFNEYTFKPILGIRSAINFHWGGVSTNYRSLSAGVMYQYYPWGLPIMAYAQNPGSRILLFMSFYIATETEM